MIKQPQINPKLCLTCRACVGICPTCAITQLRREIYIEPSVCNKCGLCIKYCPALAITYSDVKSQKTELKKIDAPKHLSKFYDIVIVGGGIAGLSSGIGAIQKNQKLKILILEKKRRIGEDVNSSAGTWYFTLDMLPLTENEKSIIRLQKFTKFGLCVEKEGVILDIGKHFLETIDLSVLQEILTYKLKNMNVQIETNSFVDTIERTDEGFKINVLSNGVTYQLNSKLLVDATGIDSLVSHKLGIHKSWKPYVIGVGAEYEMTWNKDSSIIWFIRMKHRNLSYAWSFPIGNNMSRVGIAGLITTLKDNDTYIQNELELFINSHFLFKENSDNISRINFKCGAYPMMRMSDKIITDKALRVGDSASQANPILGEGIYYAIKYGLKAGEVLAEANSGKIEELKPYQELVMKDNKKFEEDKLGYDADYDAVVKKLNEIKDKLSDKEKWAFLSFIMPLESNWNDKLKIATKLLGYSETMKLFGSVAKNKIGKMF